MVRQGAARVLRQVASGALRIPGLAAALEAAAPCKVPLWPRAPLPSTSTSTSLTPFVRPFSSSGVDIQLRAGGKGNDAIVLKGMTFFARHGVLDEEAVLGQRFVVDVKMHCCLEAAGRTDDVSDTVDYSRVYGAVRGVVEGEKRYQLIEAIAQDIAASILGGFRQVDSVQVAVKKPQVALMGQLDYSGVEIHRFRGDA